MFGDATMSLLAEHNPLRWSSCVPAPHERARAHAHGRMGERASVRACERVCIRMCMHVYVRSYVCVIHVRVCVCLCACIFGLQCRK